MWAGGNAPPPGCAFEVSKCVQREWMHRPPPRCTADENPGQRWMGFCGIAGRSGFTRPSKLEVRAASPSFTGKPPGVSCRQACPTVACALLDENVPDLFVVGWDDGDGLPEQDAGCA